MDTIEGGTILVVDDSPMTCRMVEEAFRSSPYKLLTAGSGEEALRKVLSKEDPIDVVLTDVMMPGIGGMALMDKIHEHHRDLPVILMTAYSSIDTVVAAIKKRAFDLILKPFDKSLLLQAVEKALKHHHLLNLEKSYLQTLKTTVQEKTCELQRKMQELNESKAAQMAEHERLKGVFRQVEGIKEELQRTMDCIDDMVMLVDPQDKIRRCNQAVKNISGKDYPDIIGSSWQSFVATSDLKPEKGFTPGTEVFHEPSNRWFVYNVHSFVDATTSVKKGTVITLVDTTEQKNTMAALEYAYQELKATQSHMLQTEKMASIGQLAAGVAHEINNPIGFVTSNLGTLGKYAERLVKFQSELSQLLIQHAPPEAIKKLDTLRADLRIDHVVKDISSLVAESLDGTNRVARIVSDLKVFSRTDHEDLKRSDLNACIETAINIVWNELKYKVELIREFSQLPEIDCYPQKLSQVFMNLLVNASHAIDKQGRITVATRSDGTSATITIADTGCGIEESHRARIFEPFFTTKEVGKGTGLGLSISYDIIKKHGGEITVQSEVGKGTTFTITLPLTVVPA
jgi:two-component system NtrC family sensor kinase